ACGFGWTEVWRTWRSKHSLFVGHEDVTFGAPVDDAEAAIRRIGIRNVEASAYVTYAHEALPRAAALGRFPWTVPVERDVERTLFVVRYVARDRRAVGSEWLMGVGCVERLAERGEVTDARQGQRRSADLFPPRCRRSVAVARVFGIVVAVGVDAGLRPLVG